jgi:tetratricopeptide (TPR) repeat protein
VSPRAAIVGRRQELAALQTVWHRALTGHRQLCVVSGEVGIGKSALLEAFFAAQKRALAKAWVARGQCVEQYGTGEPFLPILEGIGRLCRAAGGSRIVSVLRRHAPSWLVQLPGLTGAVEQATLERRYAGSGRERMLHEMMAGLEALTAHAPLVLVLEDLHWSDRSTLTLLAALARRSGPARLLVLGTYRPAGAATIDQPLEATVQDLVSRGEASEIALTPLDEASVGAYLTRRFFDSGLDGPLASILRRQTGGNPLFMINAVDHLVTRGLITLTDGRWSLRATAAEIVHAVPESLRCAIDSQVQQLQPATWRLLQAASVAGVEFTARAVMAALGTSVPHTEDDVAALARSSRVLQPLGPTRWPDDSETSRFRFVHALYQDVIYDGISTAHRREMHRRIGQAIATAWASQPGEVAAILAMHFERATDHAHAVKYRRLAGDAATRRHAYEESIDHYRTALGLHHAWPPGRERDGEELELLVALGLSLTSTKGFGAPDVEATYRRALELCGSLGEPPQLFPVIEGLHSFYTMRGELSVGYSLAQQMHRIAESVGDRALRCEAHHTMGCVELRLGKLHSSRTHLERAIALSDAETRATAYTYSGHDPTVCCLGYLGMNLWYSGYPDQALRRATEGLEWAAAVEHPVSTVLAHTLITWVRLLRGEDAAAAEHVDAMLALSASHDLTYWIAIARMFRGWIAARTGRAEGLEELRAGFAICQAIGPGVAQVEFLLAYADASLRLGETEEGVRAADEALALIARHDERGVEAELHRLRGELLLQREATADSPAPDGMAALEKALEIARQQGARGLELRAAVGLSRCWYRIGREEDGRRLLGRLFGQVKEGAQTADLKAAQALLARSESPERGRRPSVRPRRRRGARAGSR